MRRWCPVTFALALALLAGCGEDDAVQSPGVGSRLPGATPGTGGDDLPRAIARFDLDEDSVRVGGDEVTATYREASGATVRFRLLTFDSPAAASAALDRMAADRRAAGFLAQDEQVAESGGRLVVMSRSPGPEPRPPDFSYIWTDGNLLASTAGVGEAPGRLYNAFDR